MSPTVRHRITCLGLGLLLMAAGPAWGVQTVLHVSSQRLSPADGSEARPFLELTQARDRIRRLKQAGQAGPFTVVIHQGDYQVARSITLGPPDSGSIKAPVTYRAAHGERVRLLGGAILDGQAFAPVREQAFLARLVDRSAGEHLLVVDLKARGITDYGEISRHGWSMEPKDRLPPATLSIAGRRMTLARWPNRGEESPFMVYQHYLADNRPLRGYEKKVQAIIDRTRLPGQVTLSRVLDPGESYSRTRDFNGPGGTFEVAFDRMKHWHDVENVFLDGVLASTWERTYNRLAAVDVAQKTITLAGPELNGIGRGESVRLPHFYFENVPEEIDRPGEYCLDRRSGRLYLYPPEEFAAGPIVLASLAEPMVSIRGASHLRFEGLEFDTGRHLGIAIDRSEQIIIDGCRIANFTAGGLSIDGKGIRLLNSHVHGTGGFGVHLDGGDRRSLEPAGNEVVNCHIHDFGWEQKSQMPGVMIDGVGHRVAHCEIHDGPHFAIRVRQTNDVIVELNEIYDLPKYHKFDGGALYVYNGPRAESRGNLVRANYFHDVPTIGVYPDNFSWGVVIRDNVFRNVGVATNHPAVMVNGGGECRTFNNLMIDCVHMYAQGARPKEERWFKNWNRTRMQFGNGKIDATPYRKYDDLKLWLTKKEPDEFYRPRSHVYGNVFYSPKVAMLPEAAPDGIVDHSRTLDAHDNWIAETDPGLVDYRSGDFRLRADAAVFKRLPGFEPIPFEKMGREDRK